MTACTGHQWGSPSRLVCLGVNRGFLIVQCPDSRQAFQHRTQREREVVAIELTVRICLAGGSHDTFSALRAQ